MFKRFKVTGINENPKKPKRNLMKYLVLGCVMALPAFALLKTGVLSMNKNVLAADKNKYDIVADLDGGKFEMGTTPEFTKMDNGNWLYKYKPVPTPTKLPVPVKDGYDFTGWTVSAKPDIQKEYSIPAWHKGNLNVKANWEVKGATLMDGRTFNDTIERMSGFWDVTEIRFVKGTPNQSGTDVSEAHDGSIMANIEGNILTVASEGKIFANKDCSVMFDYSDSFRSLSIKTINFYNFDTSNVTDMYCMFGFGLWTSDGGIYPFRLEEINGIENWNTSKVTNMSAMFYACINLKKLDVSNFDTSQVTDMRNMFYYCSSLTSIKGLENFDTSNVTDMSSMFRSCTKISGSITISNPNITSYSGMFSYCSVISPAKFVVNYTSGCKSVAQKMVNTKSSNSNVVLGGMPSTLITGKRFNTTIEMMSGFSNVTEIRFEQKNGTLSGTDVSEAKDGSIKARISGNVLYVEANGEIFANEDCRRMFHNLGSGGIDGRLLNKIIFNNFNTSKVTDMSWMFNNCEKLTSLDVSNFNTSKVTDMSNMLQSCESLTNIKGLENFDTSQVTNMQQMFMTCNKLTSLDVSNFDTSKVTNMQYMFDDCSSLSSLNVSKFNTSNVTNMSYMFRFCEKLTSLDVSNFNTSKVTGMSCMFSGCKSLASLDVSNFDTSQVTNMSSMFYSCSSLSSLDVSNFNTSQVEYIKDMFNSCNNLSGEITIMNPNITNYYNGMFYNCSTEANTKFIVKYTDEATKAVAEKLVATKSANSNVFLYETSKLIDGKTFNEKFNSLLLPVETKSKVIFKKGNTTGLPSNAIDVSVAGDKSIMMYSGKDETNLKAPVPLNYQTIYIVSDKTIEFNEDSSSMFYMPNDFNGLSSITFDNIDTSNVTNMSRMFDDCNHLETINGLEKFDTSNVINMSKMFYNCSTDIYQDTEPNLKLNLNNWDISKVTNMDNMFTNSAYLSGEMTISNPNIASYSDIFKKCSTEPNAKFTVKYTDEATKAMAEKMVATKSDNSNVYLDGTQPKEPATLVDGQTFFKVIYDKFGYYTDLKNIVFDYGTPDTEINNVNDLSEKQDKSILGYKKGDTYYVVSENEIMANSDCSSMFGSSKMIPLGRVSSTIQVENITFNNFNTSNVTNMYEMFYGCYALKGLDVSNWDMSSVTRTTSMFENCTNLKEIKGIQNLIDTALHSICDSMFKNCSNLSGEVTIETDREIDSIYYYFIFAGCSTDPSAKLIVNYSNKGSFSEEVARAFVNTADGNVILKAPPAILISGAKFNEKIMSSLMSVDGEGKHIIFEKGDVTNLPSDAYSITDVSEAQDGSIIMYSKRSSNKYIITPITDTEIHIVSPKTIEFNEDCSNMFSLENKSSYKINSIEFNNIDTSKVKNMSSMFKSNYYLNELDLSNFDTSKVTDMSSMFENCSNLSGNIKISNPNILSYSNMFKDCSTGSTARFVVNYQSGYIGIAQALVNTKSSNSNVSLSNRDHTGRNSNDVPNDEEPSVPDTVILTIKDGNTVTTKEILAGEIGSLNTPSKEGMVFSGYFYNAEFTKPVSERDVISEDTTIYIKWGKNSVFNMLKSTFNPNKVYNNLAKPAPTSYAAAHQNTKPVAITRQIDITLNNGSMAMYPVQKIQVNSGKIGDLAKPDLNPKYAGQFSGYFYDKNCTIPVKPNDVVTQDIELYAKW